LARGLALAAGGCELTSQGEPDLSGPSDQGFNVELLAQPDTVNADGVSESQVRLVLRNQNGQPVTGYAVLFECDGDDGECNGDGTLTPHPSSTYVGPIQTGEVMATDSNGVAIMVYTAGTIFRTVTITVRPYNFDAVIENNFGLRSVTIIQR
jgi:hypothetical protein